MTKAAPVRTAGSKRQLPDGWRWARLGDVCEIIAGQSPPGHTYRDTPEGLPFFQGKADYGPTHPIARKWCVAPKKVALPGDILISVRAPVGPTNVADVECCIGRGLAAIRCGEAAHSDFVLAALRLAESDLAELGSGSTFSAVKRTHLEALEILLPPLDEQKRIAAILKEQMAAVERARAAAEARLEAAKALPAAYLRAVFNSPEAQRWPRKPLGEVCDFLDARRVPVNETERNRRIAGKSIAELYPYYGANGQVGWIDDYLFDEPLILLAEDGGFFGSKDKAIAYAVSGRYWVNNHAHVLRPRDGVDFNYCLHAIGIRPDVGDLVSGSTRGKLNQKVAAGIPVALPPLDEQKRIGAILNEQMASAERAQTTLEEELETINALPAALLRRAFHGGL